MRASVIVVAGGAGRRMGARTPKAFLTLEQKPLFLYSVETFARLPFVREIVLVVPAAWVRRGTRKWGGDLTRIVPGGKRRQDSVAQGLRAMDASTDIVLIHDAARPFASPEVIRRVAEAARRYGAAVPAVPSSDTVKVVNGRGFVRETPPRDSIRAAQTPQGFRRDVILDSYRKCGRLDATDDGQVVERAGRRVAVVEGDPLNFKITTPEDLRRAEAILRGKARF